jgi:hypothetical protein
VDGGAAEHPLALARAVVDLLTEPVYVLAERWRTR